MRVVVTGGAGFIGSRYVRALLDNEYPGAQDWEVTVLDCLTYAGNRKNLPAAHSRLQFIDGDIRDTDLLGDLLPGNDAVVHFAAESHVDRSLFAAGEFMSTNVLGTQALYATCVSSAVNRVVHVSTDEVYGSITRGSWTEESPLLPNSPYAASKAASDLVARSYWRTHGLDVSITRCSNNYGPYQYPEKLIPLFVTNLLDGDRVPLYGDGRNIREWLHVDDHCAAIQLVLEKGRAGEIYNVGGGDERTNLELTEKLLELMDMGPDRIRNVADRKGHDLRYSLNDMKIRDQLGYQTSVPFDEGLAQTVDWYRSNRSWWAPLKYGRNVSSERKREKS